MSTKHRTAVVGGLIAVVGFAGAVSQAEAKTGTKATCDSGLQVSKKRAQRHHNGIAVRTKAGKLVYVWQCKAVASVPQTAASTSDPVQGPQGVQGVPGPTGSQGASGPQGTAGQNGTNGAPGASGPAGPTGPAGPQGNPGTPAPVGLPHWGIIARNTIGNGFAVAQTGGLYLGVASGADKISYGNEVDFAGQSLPASTSLTVNITGEDIGVYALNAPNVAMEIVPGALAAPQNGSTGTGTFTYSTLNSVITPATTLHPNVDNTLNEDAYYLTGQAGAQSRCSQVTYCTMAAVKAAFPNATILTVGVNKGRDYTFQGTVKTLSLGASTFTFRDGGVFS